MRVIKFFLVVITAFFFLASCQKEMSFEQNLSVGTLKDDGTGSCLPFTVNGIFKEDSLVNATNYIEIQVNITETGSYIIKSDTINGYSFYGAGTLDAPGLNTVRLYANGRPVDPGINTFTITYDSSTCMIDVLVITVGPPAVYTLGGAGSTCTGVSTSGIYIVSVPMIFGNSVTLDVNVTTIGSYTLTTPVVNGISFSGSGDFTAIGAQTVTLSATGTPTAAGSVNFALTGNSSSCNFPVTITAAPSLAVYTLGGAGSACTGFVIAGTYTSGTGLSASNTVTIDVNVTTIGAYMISTTAANGVTFSKIGTFTVIGSQTVTLTGSGTPTTAGVTNHTVNGAVGTCTFSITYTGGASPAAYTLSGASGACTVATVAGTYTAGTVLTSANTVTVQVNVTTIGAYTLSTNTVNGITFSKTGVFATTGIQTVILTGNGTPAAAGTNTFMPQVGTSSCTFQLTVTGGAATEFIKCKINGIDFTFNDSAGAIFPVPNPEVLVIGGYVNSTSSESFGFAIESLVTGGTVTPGTYTMAGSGTTYQIYAQYEDPSGILWDPSDGSVIAADPFIITITTRTLTRVTGTFSGTLREDGTGAVTKIITAGSFSVLIQ